MLLGALPPLVSPSIGTQLSLLLGATMWHLAAFGGAKTDSTANENVPAVVDQGLTSSGNSRYIAPARLRVIAASIMNDTITRARVNAPSLRNEGLPEIYPVTVADVPATNPTYCPWLDDGPTIQPGEEFGIECSNAASTVDRAHALLALQERFRPMPEGKRMSIFFSATITGVLDSWVAGALTLDQTLPFGRYAVVGMHCKAATTYGARLIFTTGERYRPGCPVTPTVGGYDPFRLFRFGRLGVWGVFNSLNLPQLEIISNAAGAAAPQGVLDLVKLDS